jgi:hypothetical protein
VAWQDIVGIRHSAAAPYVANVVPDFPQKKEEKKKEGRQPFTFTIILPLIGQRQDLGRYAPSYFFFPSFF